MFNLKIPKSIVAGALLSLSMQSAHCLELSGTVFDDAATRHGIDPLLLYAVALAESAKGAGQGNIGPSPWALRSKGSPFYANTKQAASEKLEQLLKQGRSIDVGYMQVNIKWNGHRVDNVYDLLDPQKNVHVGAEILAEAISSAPNDIELGIGRYHNWLNVPLARNYGSRVLAIYRNLQEVEGGTYAGF